VPGEPRLIFSEPYFEGLYRRALKSDLTPQHRAELKAAGLDLDRFQPGYPAEQAARWIELTSRLIYPELPRDEALRLLGQRLFDGWSQTLIGSAATLLMRAIGPTRTLERMSRNFRTGDNFTEVRFTELAPRDCQLEFNEVLGMPAYYAGILEAGARSIGVKDARITIEKSAPPGAVLRVRWSA